MRKVISILLISFPTFSCKLANLSDVEKRYLIADNGNRKFYLIDYIKENKVSMKLGEFPMVLVDGKPFTYLHKKPNEKIDISKDQKK